MHWELRASKGKLRSESSSKNKKLIVNRVKRLRADGWNVRLLRVR